MLSSLILSGYWPAPCSDSESTLTPPTPQPMGGLTTWFLPGLAQSRCPSPFSSWLKYYFLLPWTLRSGWRPSSGHSVLPHHSAHHTVLTTLFWALCAPPSQCSPHSANTPLLVDVAYMGVCFVHCYIYIPSDTIQGVAKVG